MPNSTSFSRAGSRVYHSAGYLRVFGEGQFHEAGYLFGRTTPGWAERYQSQHYAIDDPVVMAACHMSGAFTLNEVAAPSRQGAPILADSRKHGLFDGFCAPIRAGYDEVGFVLLGADHLLELADYERFLLHGMCEAYAHVGLTLRLAHRDPPSLKLLGHTAAFAWDVRREEADDADGDLHALLNHLEQEIHGPA